MFPFLAHINWSQLILRTLFSGAVIFVIFGTCILILILIQKLSRMDFSRKHIIRLTNGGNVPSFYHLQVEAPDNALKFKLLMHNIPLGELPAPDEEMPAPQTQEITNSDVLPSKQSKPISDAAGSKVKSANNAVDGASQAGKGIAEKSGAIASLFGTIGSMLPGKAGAALKEQGEAARNVQTKTTQTMQAPETVNNKVDSLQKDSGKLGVKKATISSPGIGKGSHPVSVPEPVESGQISYGPARVLNPASIKAKLIGCNVETKEVAPGENLELTLIIAPISRRSPEKSFSYTIKSKQIPIEKLDREAPLIVSRGVVHFKPVSAWRYWLPPVLNTTIILIEALGLVYFLTLIWL